MKGKRGSTGNVGPRGQRPPVPPIQKAPRVPPRSSSLSDQINRDPKRNKRKYIDSQAGIIKPGSNQPVPSGSKEPPKSRVLTKRPKKENNEKLKKLDEIKNKKKEKWES